MFLVSYILRNKDLFTQSFSQSITKEGNNLKSKSHFICLIVTFFKVFSETSNLILFLLILGSVSCRQHPLIS